MTQTIVTPELEQKLSDAFTRVKSRFGYFPLTYVRFSGEVKTAAINMSNFEIKVNPLFVLEQLNKVSVDSALEGLLDHEVCHYLYHPYSLQRVILEHEAVKKLDFGEELRQYYDDVNDNLRILLTHPETVIPEIYKAISPTSNVAKILLQLYQDLTGRDFGFSAKLDDELRDALEKLKTINFLNYDPSRNIIEHVKNDDLQNRRDLSKFYRILKPIFEKDVSNGNRPINIFGPSPSVKDYSGKDIKKALKELVEKGKLSPAAAKELIKELDGKMKERNSGEFPGGEYNDNPEFFGDRFVYEALAAKYRIVLKKRPLEAKSGRFPVRLEKYDIGDPIEDLDLFNSYGGKILPGLSNKVVRDTVKYHGNKEKTPDLMIILDDSGSMENPTSVISKAVLGGFVVANEYIMNGSKVAVVRFSDRTTTKAFSKDKYTVLNELLEFKNGRDTKLDVDEVKKLSNTNSVHDYILISDCEIKNRDEIITFLNSECERGARAYMLQIGPAKTQDGTYSYAYEGKVKVCYISKEDDIGAIILDDLHPSEKVAVTPNVPLPILLDPLRDKNKRDLEK